MTAEAMPPPPRLVALTQDAWDDAGNAVGWEVVGWAIVLPGGTAVTVPVHGPPFAAVWQTLADACRALDDAWVCEMRPVSYGQWWRDRSA